MMQITISISIQKDDDPEFAAKKLADILRTLSESPEHAAEIAQQLKQSVDEALTSDSST